MWEVSDLSREACTFIIFYLYMYVHEWTEFYIVIDIKPTSLRYRLTLGDQFKKSTVENMENVFSLSKSSNDAFTTNYIYT